MPRRLSALLADARLLDPDLPWLIALLALHAVSPEIGVTMRHGNDQALLAVDDGAPLHDPEFGGSDLLVGVAHIGAADSGGFTADDALSGEAVA